MSWPTWSAAAAPIPAAVAAQTTLLTAGINSAPTVIPPTLHQYSQEQWAQAQQQNWQQWAQWQQQYQQWHQQYGAEYQKSMTAMQTGALPAVAQPTLPAVQPPLPAAMATALAPPLPVDNKPPLPPEEPPAPMVSSYSTAPPKLPQATFATTTLMAAAQVLPPQLQQSQPIQADPYNQKQNWQSSSQKRPYGQETEYVDPKRAMMDRSGSQWGQQKQAPQWQSTTQNYNQPPPSTQAAPPTKANIEELSEAEKKFDTEFAAWEAQFNKWKDQNANHPDKTQYREYEKKWESWRNSLLERREQMRRKRLALTGQTAAAVPKPPSFSQPPPIHQAAVVQPQSLISQHPPLIQESPGAKPSLLGSGPGTLSASSVAAVRPDDPIFNKPPPNQNNEPLTFKTTGFTQPIENDDAGNDFLKPSSASGGIPGLDLVPDDGKEDEHVPETESFEMEKSAPALEEQAQPPAAARGPDFDAISKGINTILGDQKLLNMLSMVSQNPTVAASNNVVTDSMSVMPPGYVQGRPNFSGPPPSLQGGPPRQGGNFSVPPPFNDGPHGNPPFNDQSNHSFEDRPVRDDYGQQREVVNNFDDQTRSSFTMGPNDNDQGFRNRGQGSRFGGPPPDNRNFGPGGQQSGPDFNRGFGRDNVPEGPGSFDNRGSVGFDNRGSGGFDNRGSGGFDNRGSGGFDNRGNNFNRNDRFRKDDGFRGEDFDDFRNDRFGGNNEPRGSFGGGGGRFGRQDNSEGFNRQDTGFGRDKSFGRSGSFNNYDDYDNYEDDDYDTYHQKFAEDEERYQDDYQRPSIQRPAPPMQQQQQPQKQQKIPSLMDQIAPAPPQFQAQIQPQIQAPIREPTPPVQIEELFEAASVIDYEHKSLQQDGPEISIEPINMFDYRHKPFNRIPIPERPKWLAESVKFIREFDPLASRFDRLPAPGPVDRIPGPREQDRFARGRSFEDREPNLAGVRGGPPERAESHRGRGDFHRGRGDFNRERGEFNREKGDFNRERGDSNRDRGDSNRERGDFNRDRGDFNRERGDFNRERGDFNRERGDFNRERGDSHRDRDDFPRDRGDSQQERDNSSRNRDNSHRDEMMDRGKDTGRQRERNENEPNNRKNEPKRNPKEKLNKEDFDDLSDEDMDWEQGEQKRHQQELVVRKSRSKSPELSNPPNPSNNATEITMIEDIINSPGRLNRPPRIVIILRGPPGSGKTFLAKQIKDKEVENGGSAPRILSLDDYFMVEHEKQVMEDGKMQTVKEMVYEYEAEMEESYRTSFLKSFKKTITDGYFPFVIVDNVNDKVKHFGEMWSFAKQNGFQVYICQLDLDPVVCIKRNVHNRTEAEIEECISGWEPTPSHHPTIDASGLLQASSAIAEVEMEIEGNQQAEQQPDQQKDQPKSEPPQKSSPDEGKKEVAEPSSMASANPPESRTPWKNTSNWNPNGNPRNPPNRGRRGYGGQTWRSRGNRRR